MKFDILVENIIKDLVNEGRTPKSSKYANIKVDADKMLQKLNDGDFDVFIKSWSGSPRYANLDEETLKRAIQQSAENIKEMEPNSFSELRDNIMNIVDSFYENKGPKRKTYDERLTKAITNLILHKEYELVSMTEPVPTAQEEEERTMDLENLTKIESAIYEFVSRADGPSTMEEIEAQFPQSDTIVDSLVEKGFLERMGNTVVAKENGLSGGGFTPILDTEDEEEEEDVLSADPDVTSSFKNTFGKSSQLDDADYEGSSDYVPSWKR